MARYNKTTFSNSQAAVGYAFTADASEANDSLLLNVLSEDPNSAAIYSIGQSLGAITLVGNVSVPSDLLAQATVGATYYSDLGAAISITTNDQIAYNMQPISAEIDALAAGQQLTDSFLYAIQMADGTVSWNTVQVSILGLAANLTIYQQAGFVIEQYNWQSPPADPTDVVSDAGAITAFAASGDLTTIKISPSAGNYGALDVDPTATYDSDIGAMAYHFSYSVSEEAIYDTGRGFGEKAFTDTWTVTTANGTNATLSEDVYGNIHAPNLDAFASAPTISQEASVGLTVIGTDHDDNASLSYLISGTPTGATLSDAAGLLSANPDGSYTLAGSQLAGLSLTPGASFVGPIDLTVTATNIEGIATASSSAAVNVTVLPVNHAPAIMNCPQNVTAITLSTTPGHIMVGDYFTGGDVLVNGLAYDGSNFLTIDVPGAVDTRVDSVNSLGQMVGTTTPVEGSGPNSGFEYDNGLVTLIVDPLGTQTDAHGINDAGQIVGDYADAAGWHGFLYTGGTYTTLDFPSPTIISTSAEGINDEGQISGTYQDATGSHGFVATPDGCGYTWTSFDAPGYNPGQPWSMESTTRARLPEVLGFQDHLLSQVRMVTTHSFHRHFPITIRGLMELTISVRL